MTAQTADKESVRLAKPVFQTMIPPVGEAVDELRGWREPRFAYILFEAKVYDLKDQRWKTSLFTLSVEARPEQPQKLSYYVMDKKFRVLHYANFPSINSANPARAQLARMHIGPDKINPWDDMARLCRQYMKLIPDADVKISALEEKLKAAEAKLALSEAKGKGKHAEQEHRIS